MSITNRWTIPSDYDPETTQWIFVGMCIPNTRHWRGVVSGAIYNFTRGRYWDEATGTIIDAQEVGRQIYGSMTMDCNNNWERIADSLESLDAKTPELKTLEEIIDDIGDSSLGDLADVLTVLTWFDNILPGLIPKLPVAEWIRMFTSWRRHRENMAQLTAINITLRGIALAETAETGVEIIDEVTDDIWSVIDTVITVASAAGDLLSGLQILGDLFKGILPGYESDDPDNEPSLRSLVNLLLEEQTMSVIQTNTQTVNCGSTGFGCGGAGGGWLADQNPAQSSIDGGEYTLPVAGDGDPPPPGWENWGGEGGYQEYKCKASNAMTLSFIERLYQLSDMGNISPSGNSAALVTMAIETALRALDQATIDAGGIYPIPLFTRNVDNPLLVASRSWIAQKTADLFYPTTDTAVLSIFAELRLDWISDRETRVCDLYGSETTTEARDAILDQVDTYFSGYSYTSAEKAWARDIIVACLLNSWLNMLFGENENVAGYEDATAIDCGVCQPGDHWNVCHNEPFDDEDLPVTIAAVQTCGNSYGCFGVHVYFDHDGVDHHTGARQFTCNVSNGPTASCVARGQPERYFYYDNNGTLLLESENQVTTQECNSIYILGDATFTCTIAATEVT